MESYGGARPKSRDPPKDNGSGYREHTHENWRNREQDQDDGRETIDDQRDSWQSRRTGYRIPASREEPVSEGNWRRKYKGQDQEGLLEKQPSASVAQTGGDQYSKPSRSALKDWRNVPPGSEDDTGTSPIRESWRQTEVVKLDPEGENDSSSGSDISFKDALDDVGLGSVDNYIGPTLQEITESATSKGFFHDEIKMMQNSGIKGTIKRQDPESLLENKPSTSVAQTGGDQNSKPSRSALKDWRNVPPGSEDHDTSSIRESWRQTEVVKIDPEDENDSSSGSDISFKDALDDVGLGSVDNYIGPTLQGITDHKAGTSKGFNADEIKMMQNCGIVDAVHYLNSNLPALQVFLSAPREPDRSIPFIGIISRIIQSSIVAKDIETIMGYVAKALTFFESVMQVQNYNQTGDTVGGTYITDMLLIFQYLLNYFPVTICESLIIILPKLELFLKKHEQEKDIRDEMQKVKTLFDAVYGRMLAGDFVEEEGDSNDVSLFLKMSVFPTIQDIGPNSKPPDLTGNIVKGKYRDGLHYLDTQFRLLREDLIGPLRCCIKEYKQTRKMTSKLDDGYCYNGVELLRFEVGQGEIACRVRFDVTHLKKAKWEKRLLHGNLVLLSADRFDTFFCARVVKREENELVRGSVILQIEHGFLAFAGCDRTMTMIEGSSFLPAYKFVLERLQEIGERFLQRDDVPYQRYLVDCSKDVEPPAYLVGQSLVDVTNVFTKNMTPDERLEYFMKEYDRPIKIDVLNRQDWDTISDKGLETSQLDALHNIFSNELCVIQGPPGTGKTFIGLRFVEILLKNMSVWQPYEGDGSIMVMCLTNHALDQFMEGIVGLSTFKKADIVRIGGKCSSKVIEQYTLAEQRKLIREKSEGSKLRDISQNIRVIEHDLFQEGVTTRPSQLTTDVVFRSVPLKQLNSLKMPGLSLVRAVGFWLDGENLSDAARYNEREAMDVLENDGWVVQGQRRNQRFGLTGECQHLSTVTRRQLDETAPMSPYEADKIDDLWTLQKSERRALYVYWAVTAMESRHYDQIAVIQDDLHRHYDQIAVIQDDLQDSYQQRKHIFDTQDNRVIDRAKIIGVTTTGAAKYFDLLRRARPTVVIVEEAAEVHEAHIMTALTEHCKHLVLIGDHKQLRPNPTMFKLAREYNLDISLFERMVRNNLPFSTLEYQHRMRPEISQFLVPHIYSSLKDHDDVRNSAHIRGIQGDVIFFNHDEDEDEDDENESKSHSNIHEAKMVVGLCIYLLNQGFKEDQITVITMYAGQVTQINRLLVWEKEDHTIRVVPVDNFQGEENDIILVSFVRSNKSRKIGFLKASNRICVSLSRAMLGLYCFGNFSMYANVNEVWKGLARDFTSKGVLQKQLSLVCSNHTTISKVEKPEDFSQVPCGGCSQPCEFRLSCGHVCSLYCHPFDPEHQNVKCRKPCIRGCKNGHTECKLDCYQECRPCSVSIIVTNDECGHRYSTECAKAGEPCIAEVLVEKPCGHSYMTKCSKKDMPCNVPCERKLPCGHSCKNECGVECTYMCEKPCLKIAECGHKCKRSCYEECTPRRICQKMVEVDLPCNHPVDVQCCLSKVNMYLFSPIKCKQRVTVDLRCGHSKEMFCHETNDSSMLQCNVQEVVTLPCGHIEMKACSQDLKEVEAMPCEAMVLVELDCGHTQKVSCHTASKGTCLCYEMVARHLPCGHVVSMTCTTDPLTKLCDVPCQVELDCGHLCQGTCSSCLLIHRQCERPCQKRLFCSHKCEGICGDICLPCVKDVESFCSHGIAGFVECSSKQVLASCALPCAAACIHGRCTKACHEKCDRLPCDEPCQKRLRCGHPCLGLCGEPCPNICLVCTPNLGAQFGEEVRRFINISPCGHNIPVDQLDQLMDRPGGKTTDEINVKCCPGKNCGKAILHCPRYKNVITEYKYVMVREQGRIGRCVRQTGKPQASRCIKEMKEFKEELESDLAGSRSQLTDNDFRDILHTLSSRVILENGSFGIMEMESIKTLAECFLGCLEHMERTSCCGLCLKPINLRCDCPTPSMVFKGTVGDDRFKILKLREQFKRVLTDFPCSPVPDELLADRKWYKCPNGHFFYAFVSSRMQNCQKCAGGLPSNELAKELAERAREQV